MPGIAWLAMHPPKADPFPWWTGYLLDVMGTVMGCMLIVMLYIVGIELAEAWRDRKR